MCYMFCILGSVCNYNVYVTQHYLSIPGHLIVDNMLHVGNVQTPSSNVRGNQNTTGIRDKARVKREERRESRRKERREGRRESRGRREGRESRKEEGEQEGGGRGRREEGEQEGGEEGE